MKRALLHSLTVTGFGLALTACASSPEPSLSPVGKDIKSEAAIYGDYADRWSEAANSERAAEKRIAEARKDIRRLTERLEDVQDDLRDRRRDLQRAEDRLESARKKRLAVEAEFREQD